MVVPLVAFTKSASAAPWVVTKVTPDEWDRCENPDLPPDEIIGYCNAFLAMHIGLSFDGYHYPRSRVANHALHAGLAFQRKGQADLAQQYFAFSIRSLNKRLELFPDAEPFGERCWIRAVINMELDTALADCDKGLQIAPNDAELLRNKGFVLFRQDKYPEALAFYNAALQHKTDDIFTLYLRGIVKQRLGDAGASADIKAAADGDAKIAATFRIYGVTPN